MKLSVLLATYNTREMTVANARRALGALRDAGLGREEAELIVADNGSSDGTAQALGREVPEARILPLPGNLGFGRAMNRAARDAGGELLLLLNSDAELTAEAVKALRATYLAHPRAGAVGALLLDPDGTPQRSADGIPTLLSELGLKSLLRVLDPAAFPTVRPGTVPVSVPSLVGACMSVKKEAFDAVGGFDERFFLFLEETDLCLRLRQAGWEVLAAPAARVVHGQGRTARRSLPRARVEHDLSRYRFVRKHLGAPAAALLFLGTSVRLLVGTVLNGLGMVLTLGLNRRLRERAESQGYRLGWHLVLCPEGWGLEGAPAEGAPPAPVPVMP